jgi:hypothetical protein
VGRLLHEAVQLDPRVRIYHASTSEMFGRTPPPQNENSPFAPVSPYGEAKLLAYEHFVRPYREKHGLFICSGILFNHESPRRGEHFVTRKISLSLAKLRLGLQEDLSLGNLRAVRDWGFAGDYVKAMHRMLQQEQPDDYVIATGTSHSVREFVEAAAKVLDIDVRWSGAGSEEVGLDLNGKVIVRIDPVPLRRHAQGCYRLFHVLHEASRPAEADIRFSWNADLGKDRPRQVTGRIEVLTHPVGRARPAVTNIAAAMREREHEAADFGGEWMMLPIASRVQPKHLPRGTGRRQRVQHRQNRGRSDSRAEQHHGPLSGLQNEASTRGADIENIAHPDMVAQVCSSRPIRFNLRADSIALPRERTRERVTAKKGRAAAGLLKTQNHVLARQSRLQRLTVRALHHQREDVRGLLIDPGHRERPKSWGNRMRNRCRREPRVATPRTSRLALQQSLERGAPSGRKRLDPQGALQSIARMIGRIEERVDLSDGHSLLRLSHLHDFVAGAYLAFLQNAEVEPRPSAGCQQCRHPGLVHANAHAIAGNARLSDLEQCAADLITVADANGIVGQPFDREVLAELPVDEVGPLQLLLPVPIGFDLVDEGGSLLTPVAGQVALTVSV